MPEIQTKDKVITLEELGAVINAKAGVTSVNSQTGDVNLTPANIGAYTKAETDALIAQSMATLIEVTNPTVSFDERGIATYPLRSGYWLIAGGAKDGFGLGVGYSPNNLYYLSSDHYKGATDVSVYLTWAKISAP